MIRTVLFFTLFWIVLALSIVILPVYYILRIFRLHKAARKFVYYTTSRWARFVLFTAWIKVDVSGEENIPSGHSGIVLVSNHQGNFDIPVYIASLPFAAGFISKKELMKFPFLSSWMKALECLPIDRNNPRESREKLIGRIRRNDLNPIFLFPEGTRSRGPQMGPFRTGTLKMVFQNRTDILPVTIDGSYRCFEEKGHISPGRIDVHIHQVLHAGSYSLTDFEHFNTDLQKIIAGSVKTR
jgi:1-acyl-sn-glycerol-3-phosphate acyltransferase